MPAIHQLEMGLFGREGIEHTYSQTDKLEETIRSLLFYPLAPSFLVGVFLAQH